MKSKTSPGGKTARYVVFLSAALFVILLLSAFVWFPRTGILPAFKGKWIVLSAASNFLLFFPAYFSSIILLSLTLFPSFLSNSTRSFNSYVTLFIVAMMIYTGLNEIANPKIKNEMDDIRYLTDSGQELINSAFTAEQEGDYKRAYDNLTRYREIDPQNEEINRAFDRITMEYAAVRTDEQEMTDTSPERPGEENRNTVESLIRDAELFLEQDKYHSAYYYASIARELGSEKADDIQNRAWEKISRVTPGREEEQNSLLFTRKSEGQSSLAYGNTIEAYYLFNNLTTQYPDDREITRLLEEAEEAVLEKAFFLEEVIQALAYPGYRDIFFILEKRTESIRLFHAEIGIVTREGIFFRNIEMITVASGQSKVSEHLYAKYGKYVNNTLFIQCIDRTDENNRFLPRYVDGEENNPPPVTMNLQVSQQDFQHFSRREHNTELLSFGDLLYLRNLWPERGFRTEPLSIELLMRIMYPFSFLVFAFFSLSIGIRSRSMHEKLTVSGYILIPFVPFLFYYIINFFYYVNRVFLSFVHGLFGLPLALIILVAVQGVLLMFSISRGLKRINLFPA